MVCELLYNSPLSFAVRAIMSTGNFRRHQKTEKQVESSEKMSTSQITEEYVER